MKRLFAFMIIPVLITSCSSEKILSDRKIAHNEFINNITSQYHFSQKQFSTHDIIKNRPVQNQEEAKLSLPSYDQNQNLIASKNHVKPAIYKNMYSHKNVPQLVQVQKNERFSIENPKKLGNNNSPLENSKRKDKIFAKILRVIAGVIMFSLFCIATFFTLIVLAFDGLTWMGVGFILLSLISAGLCYMILKPIFPH